MFLDGTKVPEMDNLDSNDSIANRLNYLSYHLHILLFEYKLILWVLDFVSDIYMKHLAFFGKSCKRVTKYLAN